jgi:DeoR/GlpR family transcriptional regulator of sugar metabolism
MNRRNGHTKRSATVQRPAQPRPPGEPSPGWVTECSQRSPQWKHALNRHAATHLIEYGDVIQVASGTTFNDLMDTIVEDQIRSTKPLDLIVLTSNLQVMAKGRDAQAREPRLFSSMQIVLTGGALQGSLESLTGEYAAKGVRYGFIYPKTVFLGAAGLSFQDNQLTITYQFQDEISTQVAYATRPTSHRVILCDHSKLGRRTAWNAELSIPALLEHTNQCTIITTLPDPRSANIEELRRIEQEEAAFVSLIAPFLEDPNYAHKDLALRLVGVGGDVKREHSLKNLRRQHRRRGNSRPNGGGRAAAAGSSTAADAR